MGVEDRGALPALLPLERGPAALTLSRDYRSTVGVVVDYVGSLSPYERAGILGGSCIRFYEIDERSENP